MRNNLIKRELKAELIVKKATSSPSIIRSFFYKAILIRILLSTALTVPLLLLQQNLETVLELNHFLFLYPSVIITAWFLGLGPAFFSTFLCTIAAQKFFLFQKFGTQLQSPNSELLGLLTFMIISIFISWLIWRKRILEDRH